MNEAPTSSPACSQRTALTRLPFAMLAASMILAACASPAPQPAPTPPPPPAPPVVAPQPVPKPAPLPPPPPPKPVVRPADARLAEGIALYDAGDYNGALRKLQGATEIWEPDSGSAVKISARKYMAFSYCVTGRRTPCRRQFDALLKLDLGYTLSAAEAGHPSWGPVFVQAKRAAEAAAKRTRK